MAEEIEVSCDLLEVYPDDSGRVLLLQDVQVLEPKSHYLVIEGLARLDESKVEIDVTLTSQVTFQYL